MQLRRSAPSSSSGSPTVPQTEGGKDKTQEWEYEVVTSLGKDIKEKLNELGAEGWILTATEPAFIFRRPKTPEPEKFRSPVGFGIPRE